MKGNPLGRGIQVSSGTHQYGPWVGSTFCLPQEELASTFEVTTKGNISSLQYAGNLFERLEQYLKGILLMCVITIC